MKKEVVQLLDAVSQLERKRRESRCEQSRLEREFDTAMHAFERTMDDYENGACDTAQLRIALDRLLVTSKSHVAVAQRFIQKTKGFLNRMPFDMSFLCQEETALSPKTTPWNLREPFDA